MGATDRLTILAYAVKVSPHNKKPTFPERAMRVTSVGVIVYV